MRTKHWPEGQQLLPAARLVPSAQRPARVARRLLAALTVTLVFCAMAPWQQNISGSGSVIAFSPSERPQMLQAPTSGIVAQWHVVEGEVVEEGQIIVELADNDPDRLSRLEIERDSHRARLTAYEAQRDAYVSRLEAIRRARDAELSAARAELMGARESRSAREQTAAAAAVTQTTAETQQARIGRLSERGLASDRERELATLSAASAEASHASQQAQVRASSAAVFTKLAALRRVDASTAAGIESAQAAIQSAETQIASARASLASIESRLARQSAQSITAPRDGVIQRVLVPSGGAQVSSGQTLAYLVPTTTSRAVALKVDGNDAALIEPGRSVRLQFEGWPALQFSGWPSVAVGTFGGVVSFVDPSDTGNGDFRVVVVPDPNDAPWPDARFLRQGTLVKGWTLLEVVSVGREAWRQLNGFPPALSSAPQ